MSFYNFGYEYTNEEKECLENIILLYNGAELYWVTCSENELDEFDEDEIFIMSYSIKKRVDYNIYYKCFIEYKDIIEDLKKNNIEKEIKIFTKDEYEKIKSFKIYAKDFKELVEKTKKQLMKVNVSLSEH